MIIPAFISGDNVTNWLKPKESTFWNYLDLFKISEFRKQINNIEKIIFLCLFICQLLVFMLTFKVKKALKGANRINLTDSVK
jgi:hypothetical protein